MTQNDTLKDTTKTLESIENAPQIGDWYNETKRDLTNLLTDSRQTLKTDELKDGNGRSNFAINSNYEKIKKSKTFIDDLTNVKKINDLDEKKEEMKNIKTVVTNTKDNLFKAVFIIYIIVNNILCLIVSFYIKFASSSYILLNAFSFVVGVFITLIF